MQMTGGKRRVLIEAPSPVVDAGRHPAKRIQGDEVVASCDLVSDGHDAIAGRVLFRRAGETTWQSAPLAPLGNDRWEGRFHVPEIGRWEMTFEAWVDAFTTWRTGTAKKLAAGQDIGLELRIGERIVAAGAARASGSRAPLLADAARAMATTDRSFAERLADATNDVVVRAMSEAPDLENATREERIFSITVDPPLARFSAWYEFFPRSTGAEGRHGTFADAEKRLAYVADMGFDIVYLPPIHPIGDAFRKGPNNTLVAGPGDPGSPWAIGAKEGGHTAVHPLLGSAADFRHFVKAAKEKNLSVALDVAFQVSPDHPWVKEHPNWFVQRPDGTIQHAENPPKKYQDVYPFDFESTDWESLWRHLHGVFEHWIGEGVEVFRVDNPHTKSLRFWEWCIGTIKEKHPEVLFLAEAFTRPKLMYALAKAGFSQSYTYFTWRHTKREFQEYLEELREPPVSDFYRPSFWPNTPDILPEHLQHGRRPTFLLRLWLAATLSSSFGIYGPTFELMEHVARPGSEDYLDSEKFQLRHWNLEHPDSLRDVIAHVNRVRRAHPALQRTDNIRFHATDDDALLAYSKRFGDDVVLVVANLDPNHTRRGHVDLDLDALGVTPGETFQVHDLVSDVRQRWGSPKNYVELDPQLSPVDVFVVRRRARTEHDFEYFL